MEFLLRNHGKQRKEAPVILQVFLSKEDKFISIEVSIIVTKYYSIN